MRKMGFVVVHEIITRNKRFLKLAKNAKWLLTYYYVTPNLCYGGYVMEAVADTVMYAGMTEEEVLEARKDLVDGGFIYVSANFIVLRDWTRFTAGGETNTDGQGRRRLTKETVREIKAQAEMIPDDALAVIAAVWGCQSIDELYAVEDRHDNRGGDRSKSEAKPGQTPEQNLSKREAEEEQSSSFSSSTSDSSSPSGQHEPPGGPTENSALVRKADLVVAEFNRVFKSAIPKYADSDHGRKTALCTIAKRIRDQNPERSIARIMLCAKDYEKKLPENGAPIHIGNLASPLFLNEFLRGWLHNNKDTIPAMIAMHRGPTTNPTQGDGAKPAAKEDPDANESKKERDEWRQRRAAEPPAARTVAASPR